jgi:hypothetical protein
MSPPTVVWTTKHVVCGEPQFWGYAVVDKYAADEKYRPPRVLESVGRLAALVWVSGDAPAFDVQAVTRLVDVLYVSVVKSLESYQATQTTPKVVMHV